MAGNVKSWSIRYEKNNKWHWFWFKIHLKFLMKEYKKQVDKEIFRMVNNIIYDIDYPFVKIYTPADEVVKNLINAANQS